MTLPFFDLELHVDGAGREIGLTDDLHGAVDIAHLAIVFAQLFGGGLNGRDRESFAAGNLIEIGGVGATTQRGLRDYLTKRVGGVDWIGGTETIAVKGDLTNGVLATFLNLKDDVDPAGIFLHIFDLADLLRVRVFDFDIEIALRAVVFAELLAIGAILLGVETAAADEPGPLIPAVFAGLQIGRGPEVVAIERGGAFKAEIIDLQFEAFIDNNRDDLTADRIALLGSDAGKRALLAEFVLELDLGAAQLGHVERFTNLHVLDDATAEPASLTDESVTADVFDVLENRPRLNRHDDIHFAGHGVEGGLNQGLIETAGGVKGADRIGDGVLGERLAFAQGDEAEDKLLGDGRAVRLDSDGADERFLRRRGGLGRADERRQGEGEAGSAKPAAAEGGVIHYFDNLWPDFRSVSAPD